MKKGLREGAAPRAFAANLVAARVTGTAD